MILHRHNFHDYQEVAFKHGMDNPFAGLLMDMGLGKTAVSLTIINSLLYEEFDIDNCLVIAPKRVVESVWKQEAEKWSHLKDLKITRIIGNQKQRLAALKEEADIHMISRDNIAWLCGLYGGTSLPFDMLVIDESSSFKNFKSQRFKALKAVQPGFKRVIILTGTPAPNGLMDLWSQIYLLDRGERLGKYISNYRSDFFKPGKRNGAIVYNYNLLSEGEQEIHNRISDICVSMKAADLLDLKERKNNYIMIKFSPQLRKQYDEFEEDQVIELLKEQTAEESEAGIISALSAAALSNKLLQFANGAIYDADRNVHEVHKLKLDETVEIIEQNGGKPILIGWTYRSDRDRLLKRLKKYNPRELKKDKDIVDWNNGKIQILMMHPASGGHGLNLQAGGSTILWFGQTWSLELYQQFNARLDRQGQEEGVVVHHLVSEGTIDEDVVKAIDRKNNTQNHLLNAVKARIKKYAKR